jgi:hypothetical protein
MVIPHGHPKLLDCPACGRRHRTAARRRACEKRASWDHYVAAQAEYYGRLRTIRRRIRALREHAASSREIGHLAEATTFANKAAELVRKYNLREDTEEGVFLQARPFPDYNEEWRRTNAPHVHER